MIYAINKAWKDSYRVIRLWSYHPPLPLCMYHDTDRTKPKLEKNLMSVCLVCVSQFLQACGSKPRMTSPEKGTSFSCSVLETEIQSKTHTHFHSWRSCFMYEAINGQPIDVRSLFNIHAHTSVWWYHRGSCVTWDTDKREIREVFRSNCF